MPKWTGVIPFQNWHDIKRGEVGDLVLCNYTDKMFIAVGYSDSNVELLSHLTDKWCPIGFVLSKSMDLIKVRSLHCVNANNYGQGVVGQNSTFGSTYPGNSKPSRLNDGMANTRFLLSQTISVQNESQWKGDVSASNWKGYYLCYACVRYDPCYQSWLPDNGNVLKGYWYMPAKDDLSSVRQTDLLNNITNWKTSFSSYFPDIPVLKNIGYAFSNTSAGSHKFYVLNGGTVSSDGYDNGYRGGEQFAVMQFVNGVPERVYD